MPLRIIVKFFVCNLISLLVAFLLHAAKYDSDDQYPNNDYRDSDETNDEPNHPFMGMIVWRDIR